MDDPQIHGNIEQLVAEEHELWERESTGAPAMPTDNACRSSRWSLDQCWDLLRQRRALRRLGGPGRGRPQAAGGRRELRAVAPLGSA